MGDGEATTAGGDGGRIGAEITRGVEFGAGFGADVGVELRVCCISSGLDFRSSRRGILIEVPEKVLRCFRSFTLTECTDDAFVDVEFVELVEEVRCRPTDEVSDDAIDSREVRSMRA